jgi:Iron-sulfur cluster binding domain of dihydroorotate dehydrogenase B
MPALPTRSQLRIIEIVKTELHAIPGQFFLAVPQGFDPSLPLLLFPFRMSGESVGSVVTLHESSTRLEDELVFRGPYGRGFVLEANTKQALILAANAASGALLVPLIGFLVAHNCEVTVLCGGDPMPESWLPPEVEYRVVDDVLSAGSGLWSWADAVYACGPSNLYDQLRILVKSDRSTLARGWAQVLMYDLAMPCGIGVCYLCAFRKRNGLAMNCREGPVHDLSDWMVEA